MINQIFIFTAGVGTRMMPLTKETPKPLLQIGGKAIIDHTLDKIRFLNAPNIILNTFYLKKKIKHFIRNHKDSLLLSEEYCKVETGGGVKNAIKNGMIDINKPLLLINGDLFWKEDGSLLIEMIRKFESIESDILLCLVNKDEYFGYKGEGDFSLLNNGRITKSNCNPYAFTGIQIINPKIFDKAPKEKIFSMAHFYHNKKIKINGVVSKNSFYHISMPEDLNIVNKLYFN